MLRSSCVCCTCFITTHIRRSSYADSSAILGLAGRTHSAARESCRTSLNRPAWRGGRLLSSAEAGIHHGGAKLPLAALPRRDRPYRMGRRRSLLCGSQDADDARCETSGSRGRPAQTAPVSGSGTRVSAPLSTFVPVAVRCGQRILSAVKSQPAAD